MPMSLVSNTKRISDATQGMNEGDGTPAIDFRPQTTDMRFNNVRFRIEVKIPDVFEQHFSGHHSTFVAQQVR